MSSLTSPAHPTHPLHQDGSACDRLRYARGLLRDVVIGSVDHAYPDGMGWSSVIIASPEPLAPVRLAAAWRVGERESKQVQTTYEQLLLAYHIDAMEKQWPAHDLGVALSVYLVGNYQMATDQVLDLDKQRAVVRQLRQRINRHATLAALTVLTRQELFEELAITGTLMSAILLQNANGIGNDASSWAKPAAQENLQTLLRLPHTSLYFDQAGVHVHSGSA
ncbi:hypothetical protein HNQ59_000277 [Chitinivorax tropicus]|uniref:Uncharacterized protein n=1 Tax=Chitinivorax tropicus TaxID=714531 RepID=A0A840MHL9_9PROT|nr:DUF6683 family protein [Chitinivorax tropicus]MBB5017015.1 hypothetical protein [Chitinivorax tropicus]